MSSYIYNVHGLSVCSCLQNKHLPQITEAHPQVNIEYGDIPEIIEPCIDKGIRTQIAPMQFILSIDNVAKYFIQNGNKITIQLEKDVSENLLQAFLFSTPWAVLLLQRGLLPLNGSCIEVDGQAIAFIGNSASGKSSIAVALQQKGYRIISDEITAIHSLDNLIVYPEIGYIQTWQKTLRKLEIFENSYAKVRPELEKYIIPIKSSSVEPIPLGRIYIVNPTNKAYCSVDRVVGPDKFINLQTHTWSQQFVATMKAHISNFQMVSIVAQKINIRKLECPNNFPLVDIVDFLEEDFTK